METFGALARAVLAVPAVFAVLAVFVVVDIETGLVAVFSEELSLGESSLEEFSLFSTVSIYMWFLPSVESVCTETRGGLRGWGYLVPGFGLDRWGYGE